MVEYKYFDLCVSDKIIPYKIEADKIQETKNGLSNNWISIKRRLEIYTRDGFKCLICGVIDNLTLDHVIPRSKGGSNDSSNLQTLCNRCNSKKGIK